MRGLFKKAFAVVLALAVAMIPATAGAATKSSTSKSTNTTATTPKTQAQTIKETETENKSEDSEQKTDEKVEGAEEAEGTAEEETYPKVTYKVSDIVIELDQYFVFATGEAIEPTITSVSGKVKETTITQVEVVVDKTEQKTDEKVDKKTEEKSDAKTEEKTEEKSDSKTDEKTEEKAETRIELKEETKTFDKTFTGDEYTVKYYKIADGKYKEVERIKDIGEYAIRVSFAEPYEETADVLFSVIGMPQTLKVSNTKFTMHVGDTIELLPSATGDGSGFSYYASRKGIVDIDKGTVRAEKPGWVELTVKTTGNKLYQPATVKVQITVIPDKVTWSTVKNGKKSTTVSWEKQSVTGYNLRYCTEKSFKKPAKSAKNYKSRLKAYKYKKYVVKGTTKKIISEKSGHVKIRAYVKTTDARGNVKYIYGAWSEAKKIG